MIFGSDYDKSLWLIMKSNKKNRDKIVDFIKNIPEELYLQIREKLMIVDEYRSKKMRFYDENGIYFHDNLEKDGKLYYYMIDPYSYSLTLGYSVVNSDGYGYKSVFELLLKPNEDFEYISRDGRFIGYVSPDENALLRDDSRKLTLTSGMLSNTSFRFMITDSSWGEIVNIGIVNVKDVPNELDLVSLEDGNKLVRRKKKMGKR